MPERGFRLLLSIHMLRSSACGNEGRMDPRVRQSVEFILASARSLYNHPFQARLSVMGITDGVHIPAHRVQPKVFNTTTGYTSSSPASPQTLSPAKRTTHTTNKAAADTTSAAARSAHVVTRALRDSALGPDALDDAIEARLDDDAADYHFAERGVQRLVVEDEVQLADVFEQAVERLDEDLDQVEQRQRGFRRRADDDEVERRVVAVRDERRRVVVLRRGRRG